jgi:hypothetical protein
LKQLLSFDEHDEHMSVDDAFGLTFQIGITDATGSRIIVDLKDNAEKIPVTSTNRDVRSSVDVMYTFACEH